MPPNPHSNLARGALHEAKRQKASVRVASTANVTTSSPGATIDGVTLTSGDRILLKDQSTGSQNGIYVWTASASALTRATDASASTDMLAGDQVYVREGTANGGTNWQLTTSAAITLGTTSLTYTRVGVSDANQSANTVKAGPTTGSPSAPTYRALVAADVPVMVASGGSHAAGAAPDPGSSAGTTKFLREDATWQVPPGGSGGVAGAPSNLIFESVLGGTAASITVSGIPGTYKELRVVVIARGDTVALNTNLLLQFNADTAGNYEWGRFAFNANGSSGITGGTADTSIMLGQMAAASATANEATQFDLTIDNYAATTFQKTVFSRVAHKEANSLVGSNAQIVAGFWRNTAAITSILVKPAAGNFIAGSVLRLYGEPIASQSSSAPATASSGTIATAGLTISRISPAGAVTGVILEAGTALGQGVTVINEAVAANTVTFAASGTSNVADGTSDVIAGLTARRFVWDSATSLWYPSK